jgi:hypothetical protein
MIFVLIKEKQTSMADGMTRYAIISKEIGYCQTGKYSPTASD